jgi:hypothetical protein
MSIKFGDIDIANQLLDNEFSAKNPRLRKVDKR